MLQIKRIPHPWISAAAALVVACAALGAVAAAPAGASHAQITFFEPEHDLLNPSARHRAFAQMKVLGVDAVRVVLKWHDVAPHAESARRPHFNAKNPASYAWGEYDVALAEAQRLKWKVLLTVGSPAPKWATAGHVDLITRPNDKQFEEFMTAVGLHYGSEVSLWAIWNEPNIAGWLMPQWNSNGTPASPGIYRGLFEAGYKGLKAAGIGSPKVLFGETSPFGVDRVKPRAQGSSASRSELAPLEFLREALCLSPQYHKAPSCGKLVIAGYAEHPYTYPSLQGPYYQPERDEVTIGSLSRLSSALDKAASAGAIPAHVPMYLTEYGVESSPNPLGVPPSEQAEYDAISEKIAWENPRVLSFAQYLLQDELPSSGHFGYRTGLETHGGGDKPLYYAFPLPLVVSQQSHGYSLWGLVRPAGGVTKVRVYVEPSGSQHFRTLAVVTTDSRGYWTLHSTTQGSRWRVSWRGPGGVVYNGPPIRATRY